MSNHLEEFMSDFPPELCELKIIGFSKDIGSSISLLPSVMHRLENLLVAIELKNQLSISFPEASKVTSHRVRSYWLMLIVYAVNFSNIFITLLNI